MLTSKQRAYLRSLASKLDPIISIGKDALTPEVTKQTDEALAARELVKLSVQKNCTADLRELCDSLAERTQSEPVQVIGRKIVLYRPGKDEKKKIVLPRDKA